MGGLIDFLSPTMSSSQQNIYHQPYETYSPVFANKKSLQLDYSYAPSVFISSPNSQGADITTKKDANLSGAVSPTITGATDTQSAAVGAAGLDIWVIALIGVLFLGGAYIVTRKK